VIYVVELPDQGEACAWFAYDDDDFARKVAAHDALQTWEIYDEVTPLSLLDALGHPAPDSTARAQFPAICALGDSHGWDSLLYRADYLLGSGVLSAQAVEPRQALSAALQARPGTACIYWDESQALAAFEGADPRINDPARWRARRALYEQLVALEVLADDN